MRLPYDRVAIPWNIPTLAPVQRTGRQRQYRGSAARWQRIAALFKGHENPGSLLQRSLPNAGLSHNNLRAAFVLCYVHNRFFRQYKILFTVWRG